MYENYAVLLYQGLTPLLLLIELCEADMRRTTARY